MGPYLNRFSIRDLEEFSGVKAHTIRIWERRYGILEPDRTDTNIRTYGLGRIEDDPQCRFPESLRGEDLQDRSAVRKGT